MVKIRLRRMGTKARPFYRVVVAKALSARDGAAVETLGTYNPTPREKVLEINNERALYWLLQGAQPTQTVAYLLKKSGALGEFFEQRPAARAKFKFLDKRTAVMSTASVIEAAPVAAAAPEVTEEVPAEAPVEAPAEAPAEAPVEEVVAEAPAEPAAEPTPEA